MRVDSVPLALSSDCSHWVLYDEPAHATCVEPQSGPPNQISDDPVTLRAGESLSRWFRVEVLAS
jgi:aldose 1-epimerase